MGEVLDVACADDADDVDVAGDREDGVFAVWDLTTIGEVLDGAFAPTSLLSNLLIFDIYYINIYFFIFCYCHEQNILPSSFLSHDASSWAHEALMLFLSIIPVHENTQKKKKSWRLIGRC